jgi:uncharacterized SAM-binding protein YcdF (DUF218 family)
MGNVWVDLGIASWKPVLTALALPPVPFQLLSLLAAALMRRRPRAGWFLTVLSVTGLWLGATTEAARWLEHQLLEVPPPLASRRIEALQAEARAGRSAIVVLGGGVEPMAPEYGTATLSPPSVERLRYGLWLSRQTGLPVAFTGGRGWAQPQQGTSEAEVAAVIASQDFNRPLRWLETRARDTRENAVHTVPLLRRDGVTHIVLVTHGWHMERALRHFEAAAAGAGVRIEPAPMGVTSRDAAPATGWLPSAAGFRHMRDALREALGTLAGA